MGDTGPQLQTYSQGQGSVSAGNLNTFIQSCDTYADMRALMGVTGMMILSRGGLNIADGQQGAFYWDATDFAPDDGINTIRPITSLQPTGAWHRLPNLATLFPFLIQGNAFMPNAPSFAVLGTPANWFNALYTNNVVLFDGAGTSSVTLSNNQSGNYTLSWPGMLPTNGQVLSYNVGVQGLQWSTLSNTPQTQQGFIGGMGLSNDGASPNTMIDVASGAACSDDQTAIITINGWRKATTGTFVPGNGTPGLDAGVLAAATWYFVFVIYNPTSQVSDVLLSTSPTSPVMPFGYTIKRRIGAIGTDASSHILPFIQHGDEFLLVTAISQGDAIALPGTTPVLTQVNTPLGISTTAMIRIGALNASTVQGVLVDSPLVNPTVSGLSGYNAVSSPTQPSWTEVWVRTDTSSRIRITSSAAATQYYLRTIGWIDPRGQN